MKFKPDGFLIAMVVAIGLALVYPDAGAKGGFLQPELLTKLGVGLIFFLHGLALSPEKLKAGTLNWRLHLIIQSCTFLLFPLLGLVFLWGSGGWFPPDLRLGFFFLCALPSTVSSSVAMTAAAHGNVAAAVFNATLSSLIGVVLTPLWVGALLKVGGVSMPLGEVIFDLVICLVLPLAVGQLLRPVLGHWAGRHRRQISRVDRGTILLLVYTSFCESTKTGVWSQQEPFVILSAAAGVAVLLVSALRGTQIICNRLRLSRADRIAAIFCGSKKTLASGVPMAQLIFVGHPGLGLILLPLILYHTLQLVVCGWLAGRWAREVEAEDAHHA